jgi:hypothetical protein
MAHNSGEAVAEAAVGAVAELVKQGGGNLHYHAHGVGQLGQLAVQGLATVAPVAVAKAGAVAAAGAAGAVVAAPVVAVAAGVAAVGYGTYKLWRWVSEA